MEFYLNLNLNFNGIKPVEISFIFFYFSFSIIEFYLKIYNFYSKKDLFALNTAI